MVRGQSANRGVDRSEGADEDERRASHSASAPCRGDHQGDGAGGQMRSGQLRISRAKPRKLAIPDVDDDAAAVDEARPLYRAWHAEQLPRLRSEEHTSDLQSLIPTSYAVFC